MMISEWIKQIYHSTLEKLCPSFKVGQLGHPSKKDHSNFQKRGQLMFLCDGFIYNHVKTD